MQYYLRFLPYPVEETLSSITLTPNEVGKASRPDGISNRIIRELAVEISLPICSLFNQMLHNGEVPDCFKEANASPVFKGGDPTIVSNNRPISVLSNLDNSLERLMFNISSITIFFHRFSLVLHLETLLLINLHISITLSVMLWTLEK